MTLQGHLSYTFRPQMWLSGSLTWYEGGQSTVDGVTKDDRQRNARAGLTFSLPVAKRLGFRWAVLDDGWQTAIGDWTPIRTKFPQGDADMKALVDRIHQAGLKAQLWWAPLAAAPASRRVSLAAWHAALPAASTVHRPMR